jgi:F0F1-type ATP synthase assembly protein I
MPSDNKPDETPKPALGKAAGPASQLAIAMELPFVLVATIVVGGLLGYFLDRWFHTKPILMIVLGALGFFAGVRDVLRRLPGNTDGKS